MSIFVILKLLIILFFAVMFIRRPSLTWGIGLLTVTAAVLIDTLLATFDSTALQAEMGFFYYLIAGALFGGATLWLWGLFIPRLISNQVEQILTGVQSNAQEKISTEETGEAVVGVDNQMLYEEIHNRFGREDILDLMFDLEINEVDVMPLDQNMNRLIINIMDAARRAGQSGALALAVERILTPPPPEYLPRLEKIDADSPPTVLRQYLMTHYTLEELEQIASNLDIDWQQLDAGAKREKTRSLLQYLYRRNRIIELIELMKVNDEPSAKPAE
ncbi:MAG: hypothetical protein R3293_22095 [Candidatus Promineifilaceae bacterium]|nr:hypothetical protein [Candidatus Promineifilaceae bacterium]